MDIHVRDFLYKMGEGYRQFMTGRNGMDRLASTSFFVAMILFFAQMFFRRFPYVHMVIEILAVAAFVYALFRMLSKNIPARQAENLKFVDFLSNRQDRRADKEAERAKKKNLAEQKKMYGKTHKFFVCPDCGHNLRVPKGQGKIRVTCPNCHTKFEAHT